jgi:hypothetical protein
MQYMRNTVTASTVVTRCTLSCNVARNYREKVQREITVEVIILVVV